jgi:hypothetical protein
VKLPVAVEKLAFALKQLNLGDRKCLGKLRKSFIRHSSAIILANLWGGSFSTATPVYNKGWSFSGVDSNDHNLLQLGRPFIMRLQQLTQEHLFANAFQNPNIVLITVRCDLALVLH